MKVEGLLKKIVINGCRFVIVNRFFWKRTTTNRSGNYCRVFDTATQVWFLYFCLDNKVKQKFNYFSYLLMLFHQILRIYNHTLNRNYEFWLHRKLYFRKQICLIEINRTKDKCIMPTEEANNIQLFKSILILFHLCFYLQEKTDFILF